MALVMLPKPTDSQATSVNTDVVRKRSVRREGMKKLIVRFVKEDEGQDLIEYALLAAFLSLAAATGAGIVGTSLDAWYQAVGGTISGMATAP